MLDVNWLDAGSMDPIMRDGRTLLLAAPNTLGTAYGGDGIKLDPSSPYFYYVAAWDGDRWRTTETDAMHQEPIWLESHEPSHYAEITPPS